MKMNAIKFLTVATTTAAIFTTSLAFSQDRKAPPPPESPDAPPNAAEALPPPPPVPDLEPIMRDVRRQVQIARDQAAQALTAAGDVLTETFVGPEGNVLQRGGARPGRSIIVPSAEMEPASIATATEDLNIMARILEKALPGRGGDKPDRRAMGIAIFSPAGGTSPIRNLYLEGYGALFFLDVPFPLLPPPKKEEQDKPKEPTSSAWEEAREELYNPRGPRGDGFGWKGFGRGEPEEYDTDKVEELKESLLDAFKHATHIRAVKPDEWITVVVNGGGPGLTGFIRRPHGPYGGGGQGDADVREFRTEIRRESRAEAGATMRRTPGQGESLMMIRARKSDADTFAKGTLGLDAFKKKATVRVY